MKKRIISLLLAMILLAGVLVLPASAATAKEVHTYLMNIAEEGEYDSDGQYWCSYMPLDEEGSACYGIFYLTQSGYIEVSVYTDYYEVTWRISSNPSPNYNAFILLYDEQNTKGTVSIAAGYDGGAYSSFKSFTGNTAYQTALLEALNTVLPAVVEMTRAIINENGYSLRDLGLVAYNKCSFAHAYDKGRVTQEPSCAASGVRTYTCVVCGSRQDVEIAPTEEHSWGQGSVLTAPTCTAEGTMRYTCTVCNTATKDEPIPALGHQWDKGTVTTEPGCTSEGVRTFACSRCSETRTEAIQALGHVWALDEILTETTAEGHGTARFKCERCMETKEGRLCAAEVFEDMPADDYWAHDPIDWAYCNGVTKGKTPVTFAPKAKITRAEVMTFLWTMAGRPDPTLTESPFADVGADKYYYMPVLWAVENGVTSGKTDTSFAPKAQCSRAEIMTFLWSAAGKQTYSLTENPFEDVTEDKYYYDPILWAYENGVTGGTTETTFSPKSPCTRAQVVTFLYKAKELLRPEPDPDPEPDPEPTDPTEPTEPTDPIEP